MPVKKFLLDQLPSTQNIRMQPIFPGEDKWHNPLRKSCLACINVNAVSRILVTNYSREHRGVMIRMQHACTMAA